MDIFREICEIIAENLGITATTLDYDTTWEEIDADSLDLVEIVTEIEVTLDMSFDDEDIEKFKTVGDLVNYVQDRI